MVLGQDTPGRYLALAGRSGISLPKNTTSHHAHLSGRDACLRLTWHHPWLPGKTKLPLLVAEPAAISWD